MGVVKLEGTGQPVAGAKLQVSIGFVMGAGSKSEKVVETGADGQFAVDLPAGNTRIRLSPPPGYLVSRVQDFMEDLDVRADQPVIRREYRVRRGTIWNFQFTRGSARTPFSGVVATVNSVPTVPPARSQAQADDRGVAGLTLSIEGPTTEVAVLESPLTSSEIPTGMLRLRLEWDPGFRPDAWKRSRDCRETIADSVWSTPTRTRLPSRCPS